MITLEDIKKDPVIDAFIRKGNKYLGVLGFTEHSYRHVNLVSSIARNILERLGYPRRQVELAAIAGYMHDIGNVVSRKEHGISGAVIAYPILIQMGMHPEEIATVISAIANHEEQYGHAINSVAAALIVADKSDVHRSRVRNSDFATFDIHDRYNYASGVPEQWNKAVSISFYTHRGRYHGNASTRICIGCGQIQQFHTCCRRDKNFTIITFPADWQA
jgi:HD superfamily phosphohydrolase YqeK